MNSYDIIIKPVITEKSNDHIALGKYTFIVHPQATKPEIKRAVEELFGVYVKSVNTINYTGLKAKTKRMGKHEGKRSGYKKAIISIATDSSQIKLHPGNTKKVSDYKTSIEFFEGMR